MAVGRRGRLMKRVKLSQHLRLTPLSTVRPVNLTKIARVRITTTRKTNWIRMSWLSQQSANVTVEWWLTTSESPKMNTKMKMVILIINHHLLHRRIKSLKRKRLTSLGPEQKMRDLRKSLICESILRTWIRNTSERWAKTPSLSCRARRLKLSIWCLG